MKVSKKCLYALRAIFELASRNTDEPVKIHNMAQAQGISHRFLEAILNELRHSGFAEFEQNSREIYICPTVSFR